MDFSTPCNICGKPVHLRIPDEVAQDTADLLRDKVSRSITHDHCYEADRKRKQRLTLHAWESSRCQDWLSICPPAYQDTEVDLLPWPAKHAAALAWVYGPKGLLFHGPTRSGKTRILLALLQREFEAGKTVVFYSAAEFSRQCVISLDHWGNLKKWTALLETADILAIDDLGKARFTDYIGRGKQSEELLFAAFEARISRKLPTMFTTNMNQSELLKAMSPERGPAFVARTREFCGHIGFGRKADQ